MTNTPPAKKSYVKLQSELAEIIEWFESDQVNVDKAVDKYEQALELIDQLEKHLKTAQNKVRKIKAKYQSP
jgi:exodeoxyribonuclease VII small subunit